MQQSERLMVIDNVSDETIVDYWDGKAITFPAGERVTLVYGVGVHFCERHPEALRAVEETTGVAPDVVVDETTILNAGNKAVDVMWDGHPYHLEPGATARLETAIANALIVQARKYGGNLVVAGSEVPPADSTSATPSEPEAATKPKRSRRVKAEAAEPEA